MGWSVGGPYEGRFIGYGVPAWCDHPDCGESIDRGLAYACGGGVMEDVPNCGLFFCSDHLVYSEADTEDEERQGFVCERCADDSPRFDPKPEHPEWVAHLLTDESWAAWRADHPERVNELTAASPAPTQARGASGEGAGS